ncbi:MAG: hypothetical protein M3680_02375 [Myxococcota bacterium]|nr:hypothetical protein [Myxococcota bacterium]
MPKCSTSSSLHPSFVPIALFAARPAFAWKGEHAHIGPPHTANAVYKKLAKHSYCGTLALISGVLQWGASAFASVRDVGPHLELAKLHFLVMEPVQFKDVDWVELRVELPTQRKEDQALATLFRLARQALNPVRWLDSDARPTSDLFHLVYLTRHVLALAKPHRAAFDRWLEEATARTLGRGGGTSFKAVTGNVARDRTWGHPLPPAILERDVKPAALLAERAGIAADLKRNRFYAPVASYLDKLSKADAAIVKGLGVKRIQDLADHAESELEPIDARAQAIFKLELATKGLEFRAAPARAAEATKPAKVTKPAKATRPAKPTRFAKA